MKVSAQMIKRPLSIGQAYYAGVSPLSRATCDVPRACERGDVHTLGRPHVQVARGSVQNRQATPARTGICTPK